MRMPLPATLQFIGHIYFVSSQTLLNSTKYIEKTININLVQKIDVDITFYINLVKVRRV